MGIVVITILCAFLLALLRGPSIFIYKSKHKKIKNIKFITAVLCIELLLSVLLVLLAEVIGLSNPGGYILASFVFVSIIGSVYLNHAKLRS